MAGLTLRRRNVRGESTIEIALAILIEDGRPVFFRQKRAGENGRVFEIVKFRTMIRGAENLRFEVERIDEQGNRIQKK